MKNKKQQIKECFDEYEQIIAKNYNQLRELEISFEVFKNKLSDIIALWPTKDTCGIKPYIIARIKDILK